MVCLIVYPLITMDLYAAETACTAVECQSCAVCHQQEAVEIACSITVDCFLLEFPERRQ